MNILNYSITNTDGPVIFSDQIRMIQQKIDRPSVRLSYMFLINTDFLVPNCILSDRQINKECHIMKKLVQRSKFEFGLKNRFI